MSSHESASRQPTTERFVRTDILKTERSRVRYFLDLVWVLVERDLKLRYNRSVLGIAWSLMSPLTQVAILAFVFRQVVVLDIPNYPAFVFCGLLVWGWFQASLMSTIGSVTENRELVRRPGFPLAVLPVVGVVSQMIHFFIGLPVLFLLTIAGGASLSVSVIVILPLAMIQFVLTLGIAYVLATLQVTFRDMQYLLGTALLALFYLTPVFYPSDNVPSRFRIVYDLNPLVHIIGAVRAMMLDGEFPDFRSVIGLAACALAILLFGYMVYVRQSSRFVDEL